MHSLRFRAMTTAINSTGNRCGSRRQIMPWVLIVEAIAQAGGALLLTEVEDRDQKLMVFTGIERARFRRPVLPGDQLRIEVDVKAWRGSAVRMDGIAYVGDMRDA